ncbi:MAG TPA: hypothetical protein VK837_11980 [Longimicrobiales bacterium]|nr:hypothetical protein [Longimicrobiales bacterium]
MPSDRVYDVDFRDGNLTPSLDGMHWGDMRVGSGAGIAASSAADPQGLKLALAGTGSAAGIGVFAVLQEDVLPLASRLLMLVEFDQPAASPPTSGSGAPEPWAVALTVKFGDETFDAQAPMANVTFQFRPPGTRLNTPGHLEGDQPATLTAPMDYEKLAPARFQLEHHFCGVNAAGRYAVGVGTAVVGPPIRASDQRVYSQDGLSGGQQDWIGALGVTLATINGFGHMGVRLRRFSVSLWP